MPAPDGVGGEHDDFAAAYCGFDYGGAAFDLVGSVHEAAEDGFIAAGVAHEDIGFVLLGIHAEEWAVGVADGNGGGGVAVEDGVGGLGDLGVDDGAGSVEARRGGSGVDAWSDSEVGWEEAGGAEGD